MSQYAEELMNKQRERIKEQERILEETEKTGNQEEIEKQQNILETHKRILRMLEDEARMGHIVYQK